MQETNLKLNKMGKNQVKSEKYKHVYFIKNPPSRGLKKPYKAQVCKTTKYFETERNAAKWVDFLLISKGKEPVNILKRVLTKN